MKISKYSTCITLCIKRAPAVTLLLSGVAVLSACGGGGGSSGSVTPPSPKAFKTIVVEQGMQSGSQAPAKVSTDASGQITITSPSGAVSTAQLSASELASLVNDATLVLTDASANPMPSCPNAPNATYVRRVTLVAQDGTQRLLRDNDGNLCTYGGLLQHGAAALQDAVQAVVKYAPRYTSSWAALNYAFQMSSPDPQGDTFSVQADGSYTGNLVGKGTTVQGHLSSSELAVLNADVDAMLTSGTAVSSCTSAGNRAINPGLTLQVNGSTNVTLLYPLGSVCGDAHQNYLLAKHIQLLAGKYLSNMSDSWTNVTYNAGMLTASGYTMVVGADLPLALITPVIGNQRQLAVAAADFSTLQADMNAWVADVTANAQPSCTPFIGVDTNRSVTVSIPGLGGSFQLRNGTGDTCGYNGNTTHAERVLADLDALAAKAGATP